jgi:hypothetical protein
MHPVARRLTLEWTDAARLIGWLTGTPVREIVPLLPTTDPLTPSRLLPCLYRLQVGVQTIHVPRWLQHAPPTPAYEELFGLAWSSREGCLVGAMRHGEWCPAHDAPSTPFGSAEWLFVRSLGSSV